MRMASRRSHAPTHKLIEYGLRGSAERDLYAHCNSQAVEATLGGYGVPP